MVGVDVKAVGGFTGEFDEGRVDARDVDRNVRVFDLTRVEERSHQRQFEMLTTEAEPLAGLPRLPDRAQYGDELAQFAHRRLRPRHAEAPLDVRLDLRAESEDEASAGLGGEVP